MSSLFSIISSAARFFPSVLRLRVNVSVSRDIHVSREILRRGDVFRPPPNTPSGSQLAARIRRRLDRYVNEREVAGADVDVDTSKLQLESMAAEKFYESNKADYTAIASRRQLLREEQNARLLGADATNDDEERFPLESQQMRDKWSSSSRNLGDPEKPESAACSADLLERVNFNDRGFYVEGDRYTDEYTASSVHDFPEDAWNSRHLATSARFGPEDAVEEIDFQEPGQSSNRNDSGNFDDELDSSDHAEWIHRYGDVDATIAASSKSCRGCGAKFHCKDASLPGFLPVELFMKLERAKRGTADGSLCRRCYLLEKHNFLLNVNVCEVDYRSMMSHLKLKQEALILLVVDMCDLPASIYQNLPDIIGEYKPMIVVGNKVDLLPPDIRSGYLKHFRDALFQAVEDMGFTKRFNVLHTALISAKTGFGVEDLITNIHLKWSARSSAIKSDVYLVGCTNVGKSTLFNTFLQSDLCKVRAIDLVQRATTSIWPGTTISLLKFPIMNPTPYKLELRRRRLLANRAWILKERRLRRDLLEETGDSKYATLQAYVGNTFKDTEEELQPISMDVIRNEEDQASTKRIWNPNDEVFAKGIWCFDTPGLVNQQQVVNLFTLDELISVLPRRMLRPRTFIVYPDNTIVLGGIARIDVTRVNAPRRTPIYMSVFASDQLPIHVMKTTEIDGFLKRYLGTSVLLAPQGDARRLERFPKLEGRELKLYGRGLDEGAADVILSSIGWVCITSSIASTNDGEITLQVYTPGARGIFMRQPPILPYCAKQRGKRVAGTAEYRTRRIQLPVNVKRLRREIQRRRPSAERANDENEQWAEQVTHVHRLRT